MKKISSQSIPQPILQHLFKLTTPKGLMQHAILAEPDPAHGYATDDNARALVAAHLLPQEYPEYKEKLETLEKRYLHFLPLVQDSTGKFFCYLSVTDHQIELGTGDWFGRTLGALAFIYSYCPPLRDIALPILKKSLPVVFSTSFSLHTISFLTLAFYYLFKNDKEAQIMDPLTTEKTKTSLKQWSNQFEQGIRENATPDWYWPELAITYDNGKIIQAFLLLGEMTQSEKLINEGKKILEFYLHKTFAHGYFQCPGNKGFWKRDSFPLWDEQALEVYSITAALRTTSIVTGDKNYLDQAHDAYLWFWGKNRVGKNMIDPKSGGVYNGLYENSVNPNEGAESYLALLLSYLTLKCELHL